MEEWRRCHAIGKTSTATRMRRRSGSTSTARWRSRRSEGQGSRDRGAQLEDAGRWRRPGHSLVILRIAGMPEARAALYLTLMDYYKNALASRLPNPTTQQREAGKPLPLSRERGRRREALCLLPGPARQRVGDMFRGVRGRMASADAAAARVLHRREALKAGPAGASGAGSQGGLGGPAGQRPAPKGHEGTAGAVIKESRNGGAGAQRASCQLVRIGSFTRAYGSPG